MSAFFRRVILPLLAILLPFFFFATPVVGPAITKRVEAVDSVNSIDHSPFLHPVEGEVVYYNSERRYRVQWRVNPKFKDHDSCVIQLYQKSGARMQYIDVVSNGASCKRGYFDWTVNWRHASNQQYFLQLLVIPQPELTFVSELFWIAY